MASVGAVHEPAVHEPAAKFEDLHLEVSANACPLALPPYGFRWSRVVDETRTDQHEQPEI